jgi:hypothetical protein
MLQSQPTLNQSWKMHLAQQSYTTITQLYSHGVGPTTWVSPHVSRVVYNCCVRIISHQSLLALWKRHVNICKIVIR